MIAGFGPAICCDIVNFYQNYFCYYVAIAISCQHLSMVLE